VAVAQGRARARRAYSSDRLHAQHKGVLGQVARVAQGVLLPQLAKQVVCAAHVAEVVGKVALEERVDAAAEHKPQDGRVVGSAGVRPRALDHGVGAAEDGGNACAEDGQQLDGAPLVGQVAHNLYLERVVGVRARCEARRVGSCHGGGSKARRRGAECFAGCVDDCVDGGGQWQ